MTKWIHKTLTKKYILSTSGLRWQCKVENLCPLRNYPKTVKRKNIKVNMIANITREHMKYKCKIGQKVRQLNCWKMVNIRGMAIQNPKGWRRVTVVHFFKGTSWGIKFKPHLQQQKQGTWSWQRELCCSVWRSRGNY